MSTERRSLCLVALFALLLPTVTSYYLLARYEPEMMVDRWLESLRLATKPMDAVAESETDEASFDERHFAEKRSAASVKPMAPHEHVCEMKIRQNFQPKTGHEQNGTRVEIQQDSKREFRATFVECEDSSRSSCHGIDGLYTSECVTVYGLEPAGIRLEGSNAEFTEGLIKVPVACQCRLRRKSPRILVPEK